MVRVGDKILKYISLEMFHVRNIPRRGFRIVIMEGKIKGNPRRDRLAARQGFIKSRK
jgi:hypothetical protein